MAHSTVLSVLWVKFEICILAKFRADVLFASNFMILPQISKQISSSELTSYEKKLENEKPELSCTNTWSLPKKIPKFMESSVCSKKKTEVQILIISSGTLFFFGVPFADDSSYVTHFRAYFCAALGPVACANLCSLSSEFQQLLCPTSQAVTTKA